jgi:hypothetical protein
MALTVMDLVAKFRSQGVGDVVSDANKGKKATEGYAGSLTKMGKSLTGTAALSVASFAGITGPVLGFFGKSVDSASDLNEATSAVKTVFGDAAGTILKFGSNSATALGQSQTAVLGAAGAFGALYKGLGFTEDAMSKMSKQSITAASDLASFYNQDPSEVLGRIRSALTGEFEGLRQYGIMLSSVSVEQRALAMTGKTAADQLTEQEKVMARQALIMEGLGAAQGDFARTSGGLANQTRILKAQISDFTAQLGQVLLPIASKVVSALVGFMSTMTKLSPTGMKVIVVVGLIAAAMGPLLIAAGAVASAISALGGAAAIGATALAILTSPITLIVAALVGLGIAYKTNFLGFGDAVNWVAGKVADGFGRIKGFVDDLIDTFGLFRRMGVDPIRAAVITLGYGLSKLGFDKAGASVARFSQKIAPITRAIRLFLEGLQKAWQGGERFHKIMNQLPTPLAKMLLLIVRVREGIKRFTDAWKEAGALAAFRTIPESIEKFGKTFANLIQSITGLEGYAANVREIFEGIGVVVGDVVELVDDLVHGRWKEALDDLGTLAKDALNLAIDAFLLFPSLILEVFTSIDWARVGQLLVDGLKIGADLLVEGVTALAGKVVDLFNAIDWGAVKDFMVQGLRLAVDGLKQIAGFVYDEITQALGSIDWAAVAEALGNLAGWLVDKGRELGSGIWSGVSGFWDDTVKPFLAKIGSKALEAVPDLAIVLFTKGYDLLKGAWTGIKSVYDRIIEPFVKDIGGRVLGAIPELGLYLFDKGYALLRGAWNGIKSVYDRIVSPFFSTIAEKVVKLLPADIGTKLLEKGSALFGGLWDGIQDVWEPMSTFLSKVADTISDLISLKALEDILNPIVTFLSDTVGKITGFLGDLAGKVPGFGSDDKKKEDEPVVTGEGRTAGGPQVAPTIDVSAMTKAFEQAAEDIRTTLDTLTVDVVNRMKILATNVATEALGLRSGIVNEFVGLNTDVRTLMRKFDTAVTGIFLDTTPTATNRASKLRAAMTNEFIGLRNDVDTIMNKVAKNLYDDLSYMQTASKNMSFDTRNKVVNEYIGLRSDVDGIVGGGGSGSSLKAKLTNHWQVIQTAAKSMSERTRSAVANEYVGLRNDVDRIMGGVANNVLNTLGNLRNRAGGEARSVGSSIGAGIRDGIASWINNIAITAGNAVTAAMNEARRRAQSASPSKVSTRIGSDIGAGFVVGMVPWISEMARKAGDLVDRAFTTSRSKARQAMTNTRGKIVNGWEQLEDKMHWRNARGDVEMGIRAEDGSYVNPGFYKGPGGITKPAEPAPFVRPRSSTSSNSGGNTYIVMTKSELAKFFETIDIANVLTDPAEIRAAMGS